MFRINDNKGFQVTLPNGVTISTQFGGGNYCDNYDLPIQRNTSGLKCDNAEVAIWDKSGEWITRKVVEMATGEDIADDVIARVDVELWCKLLDKAKTL